MNPSDSLRAPLRSRLLAPLISPEAIVLLFLPIALFIAYHQSSHFSLSYLLDSSSLYMETGIMALAMTFIIISGNIDLSVASNLCLTAVLCTELQIHFHIPIPAMILLAPLIGGLLGLVNGILIALFRLPSLTVTLGTMALYRGLAQVLVGDASIGDFPDWFSGIDDKHVLGIPYPFAIFLALALLTALFLSKSTTGRRIYAIGTNEPAARYSGIRVTRLKLLLFVTSGVFSGIASMIMLSRLSTASYTMAKDECCSELAVITAVVLGGTDIAGGRGTIFGSVIALALLAIVSRGMGLDNVQPENQLAVTGTLLVVAVVVFRLLHLLRRRR